jgi:tRNA wybutosine-synthesizing protein 2
MPARNFRKLLIENLNTPKKNQEFLPSGFQRIGHVVILNLRPETLKLGRKIANIVLDNYSYVKTVCLNKGISGELRQPSIEYLAGEKGTETIHAENKCRFLLDVTRVMLSKGNLAERARIPKLVKPGETVVDLFAGIGYFSIPIAKHAKPARIYCIEKNPASFSYLKQNIRLNKVQGRVTPIMGDCRQVPVGPIADRVLMGYLPKTYEFLPAAFSSLKSLGGVIHYHDTYRESELWDLPIQNLEAAAYRTGFTLKTVKRKAIVKEFAPRVYHVVIDAEFSP